MVVKNFAFVVAIKIRASGALSEVQAVKGCSWRKADGRQSLLVMHIGVNTLRFGLLQDNCRVINQQS